MFQFEFGCIVIPLNFNQNQISLPFSFLVVFKIIKILWFGRGGGKNKTKAGHYQVGRKYQLAFYQTVSRIGNR